MLEKKIELAVKHDHSDAYLHLGDIYFNGNGVKKDYIKAIDNYLHHKIILMLFWIWVKVVPKD